MAKPPKKTKYPAGLYPAKGWSVPGSISVKVVINGESHYVLREHKTADEKHRERVKQIRAELEKIDKCKIKTGGGRRMREFIGLLAVWVVALLLLYGILLLQGCKEDEFSKKFPDNDQTWSGGYANGTGRR